MVLRLFVPPGEGQHALVPKRPDALGANATLQYVVLSSTSVAAAYAAFTAPHRQHFRPWISRPALFVRASARLGLCAGLIGAAASWYAYNSFTAPVAVREVADVKPWRLFEWTDAVTVDDGCISGAALGLITSVPAILKRQPSIPAWTKIFGMVNIGAGIGILAAHGYLQYTGERRPAYALLRQRLRWKSRTFWIIHDDAQTTSHLNPLVQAYVRHRAIWHASRMTENEDEQLEEDHQHEQHEEAHERIILKPEQLQEEAPYYSPQFDYAQDLQRIDVDATLAKMRDMEVHITALLCSAEYVLHLKTRKEYAYCHSHITDPDERLYRLREIHLLEIAFNRLRSTAHSLETKMLKWSMSLQHKAAWEAESNGSVETWLPQYSSIDPNTYDPTLCIREVERFQAQLVAEVQKFNELSSDERHDLEKRERWKRDLEDGRVLLRAADAVAWELERARARVKIIDRNDDGGVSRTSGDERGQTGRGKGGLETSKP